MATIGPYRRTAAQFGVQNEKGKDRRTGALLALGPTPKVTAQNFIVVIAICQRKKDTIFIGRQVSFSRLRNFADP